MRTSYNYSRSFVPFEYFLSWRTEINDVTCILRVNKLSLPFNCISSDKVKFDSFAFFLALIHHYRVRIFVLSDVYGTNLDACAIIVYFH